MNWPWSKARRRQKALNERFAKEGWPDAGEGPDIVEPLNAGYLMTAPLRDLTRHISRSVTFKDGPLIGTWVASLGPSRSEETRQLISPTDGYAVYGWDGYFRRTEPVTDADRAQWQKNYEYNRQVGGDRHPDARSG